MNWTEGEIIEKDGVRFLTKVASQRFFKLYEDVFLANKKTSVTNLKEEICLGIIKKYGERKEVVVEREPLMAAPNFSEIKLPDFLVHDDEDEDEDEDDFELTEDEKKVLDVLSKQFNQDFSKVSSMEFALAIVDLDFKSILGRICQPTEIEEMAMKLANATDVKFARSDIKKCFAAKVAKNKERIAKEEDIKLLESVNYNFADAIAKLGADYKRISRVANTASTIMGEDGDQMYSTEAIALLIFEHVYNLGVIADAKNIDKIFKVENIFCYEELSKYLNDPEKGLTALQNNFTEKYPQFRSTTEEKTTKEEKKSKEEKIIQADDELLKKILSGELDSKEKNGESNDSFDDAEDENEEEKEEVFAVVNRKKAKTKEEKKKIINATVAGVGALTVMFLTFVMGRNPINSITDCGIAFKNLFIHNGSLLDLASRMGSATVYFGSVLTSFIGANKWANSYIKEEIKTDEEKTSKEETVSTDEDDYLFEDILSGKKSTAQKVDLDTDLSPIESSDDYDYLSAILGTTEDILKEDKKRSKK